MLKGALAGALPKGPGRAREPRFEPLTTTNASPRHILLDGPCLLQKNGENRLPHQSNGDVGRITRFFRLLQPLRLGSTPHTVRRCNHCSCCAWYRNGFGLQCGHSFGQPKSLARPICTTLRYAELYDPCLRTLPGTLPPSAVHPLHCAPFVCLISFLRLRRHRMTQGSDSTSKAKLVRAGTHPLWQRKRQMQDKALGGLASP